MAGKTFYWASAYNLPGRPAAGADFAVKAIALVEELTGDKCTAHWPTDQRHGEKWYAKQAAVVDLADVARADYLIFAPLTGTSRGTHVELGYAMALGKPVYGWRPDGIEGTAFDALVTPLKWNVADAIAVEFGLFTRKVDA